jgi:hypothetical protein
MRQERFGSPLKFARRKTYARRARFMSMVRKTGTPAPRQAWPRKVHARLKRMTRGAKLIGRRSFLGFLVRILRVGDACERR